MKINLVRIAVVSILAVLGKQWAYSQGTFQNLDFESPIPPLIPDFIGLVPIANALPGWTGYLNGVPFDLVWFGNIALGGPSISVVDDSLIPFGFRPIQGLYSVFLNNAAIGQTGQIPNDAASLFFQRVPNSGFFVSFGGQGIPLVQFGTSGNNIIMAGDISRFAGQTGELRFGGAGLFDDIKFSNQAIPEPSMLGLFGLGALLFAWRVKR